MSEMNLIEENCILLNQDITTFEEVIHSIADEFEKNSIVKQTYAKAVIEREKNFPTGLPADGCTISIPHTDPEHVLRPGIGVVVTKKPIEVSMMGSPEIKLQTRIFFPLAMEHPKKQLDLLKKLMKFFQSKEDLEIISNAKTKEEILSVMNKITL